MNLIYQFRGLLLLVALFKLIIIASMYGLLYHYRLQVLPWPTHAASAKLEPISLGQVSHEYFQQSG